MAKTEDLLLEIGTEELPPKALRGLMIALSDGVSAELTSHRLEFADIRAFASPRRLALIVSRLAGSQPDQDVEHKGPPVKVAFDDKGNPMPAAEAFARKHGVAIADLGRSKTAKGEWLVYAATVPGVSAAELLPGIFEAALAGLPVPRPMRWGASDAEFVRPVHWVVAVHGGETVAGSVLGVTIRDSTRGHRFMAPAELTRINAANYAQRLEDEGFVVADFAERRARVERMVEEAAAACDGRAVVSDALFDEVTALVEWPVAITGRFDEAFLELPREVIVATLTNHQRYFPVAREDGSLLPAFITLANLESKDPEQVRRGNERVIQPRLADAAFFWATDRKTSLEDRVSQLDQVVYQKGLGSVADKTVRVAALASHIAAELGADPVPVERAARLAKCDLITGLVGEFPELQGTMGRYYALADGEPADVADAIGEQYLPGFAGDRIAAGEAGRILSVAERVDTLCGIFALGKKPSGNRDPFGLRRAALGIVRTIVEGGLELDLPRIIDASFEAQPVAGEAGLGALVYDYIVDRMRAYCIERDGVTAEMFEAVRVRQPKSLLDFTARLGAVAAFVNLESAGSLSAANKRIGNILRKADEHAPGNPDRSLLRESSEKALFEALQEARSAVGPMLDDREYTAALTRLADLRKPVDQFFDDVMVMADDVAVRRNRLALLAALHEQFLNVADVSRLSIK